jgi:SRSO17 transposase
MQIEAEETQKLLECSLAQLPPVTVRLVTDVQNWKRWKDLVERYHYLGVRMPTGRRLQYLVYAGEQPIGALGWKGGSLKLRARDCFVGWDPRQRQEHLDHVINNYRFVLVDWLRVANLASHVMARCMRHVCRDWQARYGVEPWLLETFVDRRWFAGTTYRAVGWQAVGNTSGYGKNGREYAYHGERKEVYLYVVRKDMRELIGCRQRPDPEVCGGVKVWEGKLHMMIQDADYDPELIDWTQLDTAMREDLAEELVAFHGLFHDCFLRSQQRLLGLGYLRGLVSDVVRKNIEAIALAFGGQKKVRSMQKFLSRYRWDDVKMLERAQGLLHEAIGEREGMWCADSTEFLKKGKESVGVAWQYCGARGKTENCQCGVFTSFTSEVGYGLLEGRLYLPKPWFSPEYQQRREACHVPKEVVFATKIEIALELLKRQIEGGIFHGQWVGCDSFFGVDSTFRDQLATMGKIYLAAIKPKSKVWIGKRGLTVAELAGQPNIRWQRVLLAEGAKGPIVAEVAALRVCDNRDGKPGVKQWLILRRLEDGQLKYYLSNASSRVAKRKLWSALVRRWPIEQCFEDGKKHLGMDHYENRSWQGWHRHMLYVTLAMLLLLRLRLRFKKNSNAHPAPSPASGGGLPRPPEAGQESRDGDPALLHQAQPRRLSRPSQARPSEDAPQPSPLIQSPAPEGGPSSSPLLLASPARAISVQIAIGHSRSRG